MHYLPGRRVGTKYSVFAAQHAGITWFRQEPYEAEGVPSRGKVRTGPRLVKDEDDAQGCEKDRRSMCRLCWFFLAVQAQHQHRQHSAHHESQQAAEEYLLPTQVAQVHSKWCGELHIAHS